MNPARTYLGIVLLMSAYFSIPDAKASLLDSFGLSAFNPENSKATDPFTREPKESILSILDRVMNQLIHKNVSLEQANQDLKAASINGLEIAEVGSERLDLESIDKSIKKPSTTLRYRIIANNSTFVDQLVQSLLFFEAFPDLLAKWQTDHIRVILDSKEAAYKFRRIGVAWSSLKQKLILVAEDHDLEEGSRSRIALYDNQDFLRLFEAFYILGQDVERRLFALTSRGFKRVRDLMKVLPVSWINYSVLYAAMGLRLNVDSPNEGYFTWLDNENHRERNFKLQSAILISPHKGVGLTETQTLEVEGQAQKILIRFIAAIKVLGDHDETINVGNTYALQTFEVGQSRNGPYGFTLPKAMMRIIQFVLGKYPEELQATIERGPKINWDFSSPCDEPLTKRRRRRI